MMSLDGNGRLTTCSKAKPNGGGAVGNGSSVGVRIGTTAPPILHGAAEISSWAMIGATARPVTTS